MVEVRFERSGRNGGSATRSGPGFAPAPLLSGQPIEPVALPLLGLAFQTGPPDFDGASVEDVFRACLGDTFVAAGPVPLPAEPYLRLQWWRFLNSDPLVDLGWRWSDSHFWVAAGAPDGSEFTLSIVSPSAAARDPFVQTGACSYCSYTLHTQIRLRRREDSTYFEYRQGLVMLHFDLLLRRARRGTGLIGSGKDACQMEDIAVGLVYFYLFTSDGTHWIGHCGYRLSAVHDASDVESETVELLSGIPMQSCEELLTLAPTAIAMQTWNQLFFGAYQNHGEFLDAFFRRAEAAAGPGTWSADDAAQSAMAWQLCGWPMAVWHSDLLMNFCEANFGANFNPGGVSEPQTPADQGSP